MNELTSINPSNYEEIGSIPISTFQEIEQAVSFAKQFQKDWKKKTPRERVTILRPILEHVLSKKEELAVIQSKEMGMPISLSLEDVDDSQGYINWFLDNAEDYLSPEITFEDDSILHTVLHEPLGVGAVILPWNFPWNNFVWGTVQSMISGNTVVVKQSEECPLTSEFIFKTLRDGGLPQGLLTTVYGAGEVGQLLLDQDIDYISFTGSTATGKEIYKNAGEKFIPAVVELGGSAPGIIFEDAKLDKCVATVAGERLYNCGQVCDGLKRLIVHQNVANDVIKQLKENFENKKVGNALDSEIEIGPLVSKRQLKVLEEQVADAIEKGAEIVTGGKNQEEELDGAFYQPTVLKGVTNEMRVWKEEVFGPVLPVMTFGTENEAIDLANDTDYGLGGYVYTENLERAERIAGQLESGMVSVNGTSYVRPMNPFGGYKSSGIGREHGRFGFEELTQPKVISRPK